MPDDSMLLGVIALGVLLFGLLAVGAVLVIRDTIRQRGNWGINFKQAVCTQCGTPMPMVRKPANWRQAMWGGGTCPECGFELDKWGRPVEGQNAPAKWKVLRAAEEAEEREHRPKRRDERIREVNDQTQRGETP
jgi:hypothetical protein